MEELNKFYPALTRNQNCISNFSPIINNSNGCSATQFRHPPRSGIPPIPPPSPSSTSARSPSASTAIGSSNGNPFHCRSVSQPPFFALDSLPPLNPPPAKDDKMPAIPLPSTIPRVPVDRASHRRSRSDVPFDVLQHNFASPGSVAGAMAPPIPRPWSQTARRELKRGTQAEGNGCDSVGGDECANRKDENGDEFVTHCLNLDGSEALHSCGMEEKQDDLESSRMSGTMADSSENEADSSASESYGVRFEEKKEGKNKRSAANDLAPVTLRHCRSLSMDSVMHSQYFGSESPAFSPSPPNSKGHLSPGGILDGSGDLWNNEFGNGEFTSDEAKKIMMNQKLAEMAQADPKKVKRILANRQSAARSKERKMRYINELEHKVQTLQTEATTLSAQLTMLQRDSTGLISQNNELRVRLQAMDREAHLKEALNAALVAEVQRLKLATGEISESQPTKSINRQMEIASHMFQQQLKLQQQQQSGEKSLHCS